MNQFDASNFQQTITLKTFEKFFFCFLNRTSMQSLMSEFYVNQL